VRIRSCEASREVEASAKLNTGFTVGPYPLIRLPRAVTEGLGFNVNQPAPSISVLDAGGRPLTMHRLGFVDVKVVAGDRETEWVRALAVYTGGPSILLNDALMEELGVVAEKPRTGLWRFSDEPTTRLRESAGEEYWREG